VDDPVGNGAGGEQGRDFWQPLVQADRVVQLSPRRGRGDALRGRDFSGNPFPRVDAPQLAGSSVFDGDLAALVQLGDGR
jgi:hypothetical protein